MFSQDSIPHLVALKWVKNDKIILRWAPSTAGAWHYGNQYGYKIERRANKSNSQEWNDFETLQSVLLPWSIDRWKKDSIASYDDYCLIAAEVMHGKKREAAISGKILQQADDYRNRYIYAMMAADFSAQAADALALRYEDRDVKPGYTYIYRITSLIPNDVYPVEGATLLAYSDSKDEMMPPEIDHVESGDKILHLFWKKGHSFDQTYPAYYIEATFDGKTYERLNNKPFISDNPFGSKFAEFHIFSDSIAQNYQNIGYRLLGVSPFGELSPPSATVYSFGRDLTPPSKPDQLSSSQLSNHSIQINWNYPQEESKELKGFFIGRSHKVADSFQVINYTILPSHTRSFIDTSANEFRANYYIVSAIDTAGNYAISQSHYGHLIDSFPPSVPEGLTAESFANGQVLLKWKPNPEPDLLGYTVHYSNHPDHEFAAITNKPIKDNTFRDTVMIKTLTEQLYYKIVAIDKNYNYSGFSPVLKVKIPDIVPPSAAVIYEATIIGDSVRLAWIKSTSADAQRHMLYRKSGKNAAWVPIYTAINENNFSDSLHQEGFVCFYKVHAYDEVNNESIDAPIISVMMPPKEVKPKDIQLKASKVNDKVVLTWLSHSNDSKYTLYKSDKSGKFTTLARTQRTRYEVPFENEYVEFAIRITHPNGRVSDFSPSVSIQME